ncbi:uncharacterized protein LOC134803585 [Cydia splendana]|uniref:uncharacterized protein LOC134803585 n=1 Tax=Cydia splendana TaxID=1100963 RepID=UPI00300C7C9C
MAVSGEVYEQDGGVKLHPYLIALARWCVSCLWSTASAMLYRLLTNPLPQITAPKYSKPRPAGKEHLHPEPKVECVVLHQPETPKVDVIFVHGLYGSLGNTWRQGEWRSKYKIEPNKISLRRPNSIPACDCNKANVFNEDANKIESIKNSIKLDNENILNFNDKEITFTKIDEYYKRITDDEMFITEKFYKDQCEVVDNYDTQAKFVRDLFNMENLKVEKKENDNCRCRAEEKRCEVGCGCICDECYSACWPRDWIKEDYPHARVISINYTSDPHLWRPLWIKQCKRLQLHERAEQMISQLLALGVGQRPIVWVGHSKGGLFIKQIYCEEQMFAQLLPLGVGQRPIVWVGHSKGGLFIKQIYCEAEQMIAQLLALGVGQRPIVWVGHSKGGLFIKQIYCEAYEAYTELHGNQSGEINDNEDMKQNCDECDKDNEMNHKTDSNIDIIDNNDMFEENKGKNEMGINERHDDETGKTDHEQVYEESIESNRNKDDDHSSNINDKNNLELRYDKDDVYDDSSASESSCDLRQEKDGNSSESSNRKEDLSKRAQLWSLSSGFMFYSVPHRGSPLADIKTPLTARSIELLEMGQDCSLVSSLHLRWLRAAAAAPARVRSLVETARTLMAVLWLRIVSTDSADAGIGALCGVSVDHREICKPSSRHCILYTELKALIHAALEKCGK